MLWYHYVSYFIGGFALINVIPHYTRALTGRTFPTPFASPSGRGQSSPFMNVIWSLINAALAYTLLVQVGEFDVRNLQCVLPFAAGIIVGSLQISYHFSKVYEEDKKKKIAK
jgi:glucose uptake protein GlcU